MRKTRADPNSALSAYYGARRVLDDFGSYLPPMKSVLKCLKGLRVYMVEEYGDDCFAQVQAQPWPQRYLEEVMRVCTLEVIPGWSSEDHEDFLDEHVFSLNLGCRKVEIPRYRKANCTWLMPDLTEVEPVVENLSRVADGWWLRLSPVCSKTDYDNRKYGCKRMWFCVDSSAIWNLSTRLLRRELASLCEPSQRSKVPLFPASRAASDCTPVSTTVLAARLEAVKAVVLPAPLVPTITWHSSRVTLASKLRKLGKDWARIQTVLRWEGIESARIYGRSDAESYSSDVAEALLVDAHGVLPSSLPPLEPVDALAMIDDALASPLLEARDAAAERRATSAELAAAAGRGSSAKGRRTTSPSRSPVPVLTPPAPSPSPAAPATPMRLASGATVDASLDDSWGVIGAFVSIPESAWDSAAAASKAERYEVVGFAALSTPPAYVVRVVRGPLLGSSYLASPAVVKSVLPRGVRTSKAAALRRPPGAM